MDVELIIHLVKRYGHFCSVATEADERDRMAAYRRAIAARDEILGKIVDALKQASDMLSG